jgi:hypothetical protein
VGLTRHALAGATDADGHGERQVGATRERGQLLLEGQDPRARGVAGRELEQGAHASRGFRLGAVGGRDLVAEVVVNVERLRGGRHRAAPTASA